MATNPPSKLRVLVDANILVAGIGWPRFPYAVLQHAFAGDYQLVLTDRIIQEAHIAAAEVIPSRAHALDEFLKAVAYEMVSTPTEEVIQAHLHLVSRDPKDVHVALAAIAAQIDFLVSQDRDMTDRDQTNQALHEQIKVLLPGTFLREHLGWTSEQLEAIRSRRWEDLT